MMFGLLLSLSIAVSCSETEESLDSSHHGKDSESGEVLIIEASQESHKAETRTTLQTDGSVFWNPADQISLFFISGENGGNRFTSQNKETTAIAQFSGVINGITGGGEGLGDDAYFWAIYPYSEENSCDGESLTTTLPNKQVAVEGTFADDLFITVARSGNVKMGFKNVCGGIKFCVSQTGIKSVSFRGNNNEMLAGKVRVAFDEGNKPKVIEILDGETEVTVTAPNGGEFEPGKFYYLILLPTPLEYGFTMTFNKADDTCIVYNRSSGVTIKRSIFSVARNLDTGEAVPKDEVPVTGGSESGFYLGIIGFNNNLYISPIRLLMNDYVSNIYSFIDGLSMADFTMLYYAVDQSIDMLQSATFPSNISDVSIVTFTDGLDRGSLGVPGNTYLTNDEYLAALNARLVGETVSGQEISAYSIGLGGKEEYPISVFQNNLNNLATSSENWFLVSNMDEVNAKFSEIADQLSETKYIQDIIVKLAAMEHLARCRFTFDNASSATSSKQYIEGTFNLPDGILTDVVYGGITAKSGLTIVPEKNMVGLTTEYVYTFEGVQTETGETISKDNVSLWYKVDGKWVSDHEEITVPDKEYEIEKVKKTAAILLNLDCTSSLGEGDFATLQKSAKSFVAKLLENAVDPYEVASISLDKSAASMAAGETITLNATVLPTTALIRKVEWSSTNPAVASVSQNGIVTAHATGSALIIAKTVDGGLTAACYVTVTQLAEEVVLSDSSLSIYTGETATLTATVLPEDTTNKQVTWSSSNSAVTTVDSSGKITPKSAGSATITATTKDGTAKTATCKLNVLQHVGSVNLDYNTLTLNIGNTKQLTVKVLPDDATNKKVSWDSSDSNIASVDSKGLITALSKGKVQITATSEDGGKIATCNIEVKRLSQSITLNLSELTLYEDEIGELSATVLPEETNNKEVTWSSSDTAVATVDSSGKITPVSAGQTTITVTAKDGSGKKASCKVTILQHVKSLGLNYNSLVLYNGETKQLTATISPSTASNKNIVWKSSNDAIVSVNQSGMLTALSKGKVQITATSEDGGKIAACDVEVRQQVTSVTLNHTNKTLYVNESLKLESVVVPDDANNRSVTWSSSNSSVASVDQTGLVQALAAGSATITVSAQDGSGVVAQCAITVKQYVSEITLNRTNSELFVNETLQLSATIAPSTASNKTLKWSSTNNSVATVDQSGLVRALASGETTILVEAQDGSHITAECSLSVKQPVTSIKLNTSSATLYTDESIQLSAVINPTNAYNPSVLWSSSNPSVASVDQTGLAQAHTAGSATITVRAQDGSGIVARCTITVKQHVTSIGLSSSSINLYLGTSATLDVIVNPSNSSNKNFIVESSDESIVSVMRSGTLLTIKSLEFGTATITITAEDGGYTAKCDVSVVPWSETPENMTLAVERNGTRYFIPISSYKNCDFSCYTKQGITIITDSRSFILDMDNVFPNVKQFGEANYENNTVGYGLPNVYEAEIIVSYWEALNEALIACGGAPLGDYTYYYWTNTHISPPAGTQISGRWKNSYCYSSTGLVCTYPDMKLYVRKVYRIN